MPLAEVWRLTSPWYADRLDERWLPKSADVIERLFGDAGLTGEFWRVR